MSQEFQFEVFDWKKQDDFCAVCGRKIGKWAKKHSHKCQKCNLTERMQNIKEQLQRVSQ